MAMKSYLYTTVATKRQSSISNANKCALKRNGFFLPVLACNTSCVMLGCQFNGWTMLPWPPIVCIWNANGVHDFAR